MFSNSIVRLFPILLISFSLSDVYASKKILNFNAEPYSVEVGSSLASADQVSVELNYLENEVKITAIRNNPCPEGMFCAAVVAPYIKTLKIQKVETDSCGIKNITAKEDQRPADGLLTLVKMQDGTEDSCQYFRAPDYKFQMIEKFYDRINGQNVTSKATFFLKAVNPSIDSSEFSLSEVLQIDGFGIEIPQGSGSLKISQDEVSIFIPMTLNCGPGMMCPAYMPHPVSVRLPIVSRTRNACNETIEAFVVTQMPEGQITERLTIVDSSLSICENYLRNLATVTYVSEVKYMGHRTSRKMMVLGFNPAR